MDAKSWLFVALTGFLLFYLSIFIGYIREARQQPAAGDAAAAPTPLHLAIGLVTNFFDTLGIGSFAATAAVDKLKRLPAGELIPPPPDAGPTPPPLPPDGIYDPAPPLEPHT